MIDYVETEKNRMLPVGMPMNL